MCDENENLREQFAEARAIYFAMLHGAITRSQAILLTMPILHRINATVILLAREYKVKPKYITFQDLGVNI